MWGRQSALRRRFHPPLAGRGSPRSATKGSNLLPSNLSSMIRANQFRIGKTQLNRGLRASCPVRPFRGKTPYGFRRTHMGFLVEGIGGPALSGWYTCRPDLRYPRTDTGSGCPETQSRAFPANSREDSMLATRGFSGPSEARWLLHSARRLHLHRRALVPRDMPGRKTRGATQAAPHGGESNAKTTHTTHYQCASTCIPLSWRWLSGVVSSKRGPASGRIGGGHCGVPGSLAF